MTDVPSKSQNIRLMIKLAHIEPPIWRRIQVPMTISLLHLHDALQATLGWTRSHMHEFLIDEIRYGTPDKEAWSSRSPIQPESNFCLYDVLKDKDQSFTYTYDFGDNWVHGLIVEEILDSESDHLEAYCLGGERACPPEDIGGPFSYPEFLRAIADPSHEAHDYYMEGMGEGFDPEAFDLDRANKELGFMAEYWETLK